MKLEKIVQRLIKKRKQAEDEQTIRKTTSRIQDILRNDFGNYILQVKSMKSSIQHEVKVYVED